LRTTAPRSTWRRTWPRRIWIRARLCAEQADYRAALHDFDRAIELKPALLEAYLGRGIVIRLLTRDHPAQAVPAGAMIEAGAVFVPRTVVLEAECVLRTIYQFERGAIATSLEKLLALPAVEE
jgi:hypothetical protein